MDKITQLIKDEIKRKYKSLNKFSEEIGIPYSTLSNGLNRGIGSMSYDTVMKICNYLNLKHAYDADLTIFNERFQTICNMLESLDNEGVHTVETILKVEYERCNNGINKKIKSYNGIAFASDDVDYIKQTHINDLINKAAIEK